MSYGFCLDFKESSLKFEIGVSISVPRACIVADKLTRNPDISFISVDTDELTQLVYGVDQYRNETIMVIMSWKGMDNTY